jgi:cell division protein FtsW
MSRTERSIRIFSFDFALLLPVLFLTGIGVAMVYSASSELALKHYGNEYHFLKKELAFAGLGMLALLICRYFPYRFYARLVYGLLPLAVLLLVAVFIDGIGYSAGGASRWIKVMGLTFQPVEFARFALVVFTAYSLCKKQDRVEAFSIGFVPHVAVLTLLSVLVILQPDFGSTAILWMLVWVMMFAGRVPLRHLLLTLLLIAPAALYLIFTCQYRFKRYITFLDPWKYPLDEGYQIIHSLMAFGSGGIWGKGFGQGYQKLFYLPTPHTDFIFSVIGEEGGLRWVLIVLGLYLIILWRGIDIARSEREFFGALLALGLTASIALQAVVNMGVNLSLLPTKGLTLPFLSYGGTALIINLAFIGVLLNIWASQKK